MEALVVLANPTTRIVLVLTLKWTDEKQWDKLNPDNFHLTAGESRYNCIIKMSGRVGPDGKIRPDYRLVFLVPKATTSFVLHNEKASAQFSVTGPAKASIR